MPSSPQMGREESDESSTIDCRGRHENRKLGKTVGRSTESCPPRGAASGAMQVNEQPKVGPKGERLGSRESNYADYADSGKTFHGAGFDIDEKS